MVDIYERNKKKKKKKKNMVGAKYQRRYDYLDEINAENRMRKGDMRNADAVDALMEEFDIGYSAANNTSYSYRKDRGLIE